jgi:hypothetical protein
MYENVMPMGSDPEVFIKPKGARTATSAHLLDGVEVGTIKKDGFALEFHPRAGTCRDDMRSYFRNDLLQFNRAQPELELIAQPTMRLNAKSVDSNAPDDVMGYGCVPDFDAYSLKEKNPPTTGYHDNDRYTGGHMHFQLTADGNGVSFMRAAAHAIMADIYLGIPLVAMLGKTNDFGEAKRRRYYGQAGSFRHTSYGFEYRVPSSIVFSSAPFTTWAFGQLRRAILEFNAYSKDIYAEGWSLEGGISDDQIIQTVEKWEKEPGFNTITKIINEHDVDAARSFVDEYDSWFYSDMYQRRFYDLLINADKEGVRLETNMLQGWNIGDLFTNPRSGPERVAHCYGIESAFTFVTQAERFANYKAHVPLIHKAIPPMKLIKTERWGSQAL